MNDWQYPVWFIVMAVVAGAASLGGITLTYFLDKHRNDPPRATPIRTRADAPDEISVESAPRVEHQAA
jgi:NhaP-type Na+/H+ or K+/H+ antiporter